MVRPVLPLTSLLKIVVLLTDIGVRVSHWAGEAKVMLLPAKATGAPRPRKVTGLATVTAAVAFSTPPLRVTGPLPSAVLLDTVSVPLPRVLLAGRGTAVDWLAPAMVPA